MKQQTFTKLKKEIPVQMKGENIYQEIKQTLKYKSEGWDYETGICCIIDGIEYFIDITARVTKESYSEIGTTDETISYESEIEYEVLECYHNVRNPVNNDLIKISGILTQRQEKAINNLLN